MNWTQQKHLTNLKALVNHIYDKGFVAILIIKDVADKEFTLLIPEAPDEVYLNAIEYWESLHEDYTCTIYSPSHGAAFQVATIIS